MEKPKLIVFDLDYTLWPFWVDTHFDPPFNKRSDGEVYDARGHQVKPFKDVPEILKKLHSENYTLAVASRTSCTDEARQLTALFDWDKYFTYKEIYPGCKVQHFKKFHEYSNIPYEDMLFFDDEHRNIVDIGGLGVTAVYVENKMTKQVVEDGLKEFSKNKARRR